MSESGYKEDARKFLESIEGKELEWANINQLPTETFDIVLESNASIDDFMDPEEETGAWRPEEFGFIPSSSAKLFFEKRNFELVPKQYNYWLCRKKTRNSKGNTEYLVKFYVKILPTDVEFAKVMLTKALE